MTTASAAVSTRWWRRRGLQRFVLVMLVLLLALLVARFTLDIWAAGRVRTEIARLEARYGSLDGAIMAPAVPADDNRARIVQAAAALVRPRHGDPGSREVLGSRSRFEQLKGSSPVPADLRAMVQANQDALRLVDAVRQRRQSSWSVDYLSTSQPDWLVVRELSNVLYLASLVAVDDGKADGAATTIEAGLAVNSSIANEPSLIAQLLRISMAVQQCKAVKRLLERAEPSKAALLELARSLVEARATDPMHVGLLGELKYANAAFAGLERGQTAQMPEFFGSRSTALTVIARPVVRLARYEYLSQIAGLLEIQSGPRPRPSFPDASASSFNPVARLTGKFTSGLARSIESGDLFRSVVGATEVGVALRRYRLDHSAYPDDLAALMPRYLANLPIDPFTGRPPVYAKTGGGFTLKAQGGPGFSQSDSALEWAVVK